MKAKVTYKINNKLATKVIEVSEDEPNRIVVEFIRLTGLDKYTYISKVYCRHTTYYWRGMAKESVYFL